LCQYKPDNLKQGFEEKGYTIESDRKEAITLAISASGSGDTVLVAGKGHEDYQIIGNKTVQFDDRIELTKALTKHAG